METLTELVPYVYFVPKGTDALLAPRLDLSESNLRDYTTVADQTFVCPFVFNTELVNFNQYRGKVLQRLIRFEDRYQKLPGEHSEILDKLFSHSFIERFVFFDELNRRGFFLIVDAEEVVVIRTSEDLKASIMERIDYTTENGVTISGREITKRIENVFGKTFIESYIGVGYSGN